MHDYEHELLDIIHTSDNPNALGIAVGVLITYLKESKHNQKQSVSCVQEETDTT